MHSSILPMELYVTLVSLILPIQFEYRNTGLNTCPTSQITAILELINPIYVSLDHFVCKKNLIEYEFIANYVLCNRPLEVWTNMVLHLNPVYIWMCLEGESKEFWGFWSKFFGRYRHRTLEIYNLIDLVINDLLVHFLSYF